MTRLTESAIENFAIKLFERLGCDYFHVPDNTQPKLMSDEVRVAA